MAATVRLQREPFDAGSEAAKLRRGRGDIGAVVTFTGICRQDEAGAPLAAMTLEHYPGMAEAEIVRHVEAAERRWPLLGVAVVHRYGRLEPGEEIVRSPSGCFRGRRIPDGLSQNARAVLETGRACR